MECSLIADGLVCVFNAMGVCTGVDDICNAPYHCPAVVKRRERAVKNLPLKEEA